jgi:D-alanyl-D-alanine carboxypeptidase
MVVSRALRLSAFLLASVLGGTAALANGPALVVDAASGKVLHAERATDPWFPASVTKLMTVYVALDLVKRGEARLDQLLTVSEAAHALPPSKMAFKPGAQITLDNALKIIMVKSANDVAAVIAENLGGSVEGFAILMNDTARRIGMRESHWVNPHGLPDDRQHTSARDMAVLARALFTDFPQHGELFQIGAIQFGRRIMRNHNGLIGRYPGADGMKTGFICASGFNVVASATRNGRRLITVVMGSTSANERTLKAAELFDLGFERTAFMNPTLDKLPASTVAEAPNMRPVICDRRGPMPGEDDTGGLSAATEANPFSVPNLMAYASAPVNRTVLGPRGPVQPVRVWLGPNPPSEAELTAQAQAEEAEEKARVTNRKERKGKAVAAKPDEPVTPAAAPKPADPKPVEAKPAAAAPKVVNLKPDATPAAGPKIINVKPEASTAAPKPAVRENGRASLAVKPVHADDKPKPALKIMDGPETKAIDVKKPAPAKPAAAEKPAPKAADKPAEKPAPKAAAEAKPAAPAAKTAAKPAAEAKPPAEAKPAAKPAAEAKPAAKPAAEAKPKTASKEAPKT